MKNHRQKMIAPIIVTVLIILYYIAYFGFLLSLFDGVLKIVFAVFPIVFAAVTVFVCIERIKEIRKGEEDDISKY